MNTEDPHAELKKLYDLDAIDELRKRAEAAYPPPNEKSAGTDASEKKL